MAVNMSRPLLSVGSSRTCLHGRVDQSFIYAGDQTVARPVDCSVPQGSVLGPRCFVS